MKNKVYAVIDTNVIVSALIAKSVDSNPTKIFKAVTQNKIIPLYNNEILKEYTEVLLRPKFNLTAELVNKVINAFKINGLNTERVTVDQKEFPDPKDIVFYEVALSHKDSFLITGNIKHFPGEKFVITPTEMIKLLDDNNQ